MNVTYIKPVYVGDYNISWARAYKLPTSKKKRNEWDVFRFIRHMKSYKLHKIAFLNVFSSRLILFFH
jgi:hypothetical protein